MLKKLRLLFKYLGYLAKAKTKHGVHSPFVYELITEVFDDRQHYPVFDKIENHRRRMLQNRNVLEVVDFGAPRGNAAYTTSFTRVQDIARKSAITPRDGRLLHRLVKYLQPAQMIEMGSSLGISSIYQATGMPDSFFIGMEGCASTAMYAEESLRRFSNENQYSLVLGNFSKMLPDMLERINSIDWVFIDGDHSYKPTMHYFNTLLPLMSEKSVMIIHDIYWSAGMERAWEEIKQDERVVITIDIFSMGLIFFRKGMPKQNFIVRF